MKARKIDKTNFENLQNAIFAAKEIFSENNFKFWYSDDILNLYFKTSISINNEYLIKVETYLALVKQFITTNINTKYIDENSAFWK